MHICDKKYGMWQVFIVCQWHNVPSLGSIDQVQLLLQLWRNIKLSVI